MTLPCPTGFKLATLNQLKSTKTADSKLNLLQYIVQYVGQKYPEAKGVVQDLAPVAQAGK